jgi:hypothetical protein
MATSCMTLSPNAGRPNFAGIASRGKANDRSLLASDFIVASMLAAGVDSVLFVR